MKSLKFFLILFLVMPSAFADTSMKAQFLVVGQTQSWLSGQKKRMETQILVVGKVVIITRVDRGVEWILNPEKKMYQEKPIALPYLSDDNSNTQGSTDISQNNGEEPGESPQNDCVPELQRIPGTKVIAGFKTTGFSATCGSGPSVGKIWMAPPLGTLEAVSNEWAAYYHAHAVALYTKYPPAEQAELIPVTEKMGDILKDLLGSRLGHPTQFPKGVIMAIEGKFSNNGAGPSKTVYEVKEISAGPVDPNLFEVPAGYQKVPDLTKAMIQSSLQNFTNLAQTAKKFFAQSGMAGAGTEGNPLAGMIQQVKKAFQDFMASQKSSGQAQ